MLLEQRTVHWIICYWFISVNTDKLGKGNTLVEYSSDRYQFIFYRAGGTLPEEIFIYNIVFGMLMF